jgi:hypothetical protein
MVRSAKKNPYGFFLIKNAANKKTVVAFFGLTSINDIADFFFKKRFSSLMKLSFIFLKQ